MKTIKQLKITAQEFAALVGVQALLATKEIRHNPNPKNTREFDEAPVDDKLIFNMQHAARKADCGTIGCIGGHMAMLMGIKTSGKVWEYVSDERSQALGSLFYPSDKDGSELDEDSGAISWDDITKSMAVKAIDNFLKFGNPRWWTILKTRRR